MKSDSITDDPDMQNATAALIRAAKRARKIAEQTGTAIVIVRDGQIVRETPHITSSDSENKQLND